MDGIRDRLALAGALGVVALCCGAHLLVVAAAAGAIGAGLAGAPLGPALGVTASVAVGAATVVLARRLARVPRDSTGVDCCADAQLTKEASAR